MAVLVTLGLITAACHTTAASKTPGAAPHVLGQHKGTPEVVGQPAPAGTGQLDAVSCADALHCWAVGSPAPVNAVATPTTVPAGATTPTSTTTPSPTTTPATPTAVDATTDGGKSWVAESLTVSPAPALTGIACPGVHLCMAVGLNGTGSAGIVVVTRDGGNTWATAATPPGAVVLTSVDCVDSDDCTAIASDGTTFWSAHSADFGTTWTRQGALPAGIQDAGALSCATSGTCLVTGFTATTAGHGQGAIAISTDGGVSWTAATVPAGTGLVQSALCTTVTTCLAVGTTSTTVSAIVAAHGAVLSSDDGGHTWVGVGADTSQPVDDMYALACPSPSICTTVGTKWTGTPAVGQGSVARSTDGGLTFGAATTEYTPLALTAVACPAPRQCVAAGGNTVARLLFPRPATAHAVTPGAGTRPIHSHGAD
jgi:photosystem II stability/assembly factor-like uncharacterized protein